MENTCIKYLIATANEEDLGILGIYKSVEEAYAAMCADFCKAVGIDQKDLEDWLEETDDAGIDEMQARALDCTTEDGHNHDWKIFPIFADGECRLLTADDENVVSATFVSNMDSGAKFNASCHVNTKTKKVFDIGDAGEYSDDDSINYQSVLVPINDAGEEKEYTVVDLDELMLLEQGDELLASLREVKNNCFWMAAKVSLDDLIKELEGKKK